MYGTFGLMILIARFTLKIITRDEASVVGMARTFGLRKFVRCVYSAARKRDLAMSSVRLARAYYLCLYACALNASLIVIAGVAFGLGRVEWTRGIYVSAAIPLLALTAAVIWLVWVLRKIADTLVPNAIVRQRLNEGDMSMNLRALNLMSS